MQRFRSMKQLRSVYGTPTCKQQLGSMQHEIDAITRTKSIHVKMYASLLLASHVPSACIHAMIYASIVAIFSALPSQRTRAHRRPSTVKPCMPRVARCSWVSRCAPSSASVYQISNASTSVGMCKVLNQLQSIEKTQLGESMVCVLNLLCRFLHCCFELSFG